MTAPRGLMLLIGSVLLLFAVQIGRVLLDGGETPADFVFAGEGRILVELGGGFCPEGVVQKSDALLVGSVIEMTCAPGAREELRKSLAAQPLEEGIRLQIVNKTAQGWEVERSWMSAARQIELGIPLRIDRLTAADWCDLPGVGPALAATIIQDRQQNGDFGSIDRLIRVKGIGHARVAAWKKFF